MDVKVLDTREGWKQFVDEHKKYAEVARYPVVDWGDYKYMVIGEIKLQQGLQRLEVIDVTNIPDLLFVHKWPGISDSVQRDHAILIWPDEGHLAVLRSNGKIRWVSIADLAIRVTPGTKADAEDIREQQIDELEAHIDAGGHLF